MAQPTLSAINNQRVLVTGHSGFKGAWLCLMLQHLGADVIGLSLPTGQSQIFEDLELDKEFPFLKVDIRDQEVLSNSITQAKPDFIFHLAAQALVIDSYEDPISTIHTNVIGTMNVLEASRKVTNCKGVVIATTDKVYRNLDTGVAFVEESPLGGDDPYSGSKAAAEIVAQVWRNPSLNSRRVPIVAGRAGNVIGGGDKSAHRLLPDLIHSFKRGVIPVIRNPDAIRPWQHVLDPLNGYLMIAARILSNLAVSNEYNLAPSTEQNMNVLDIANFAAALWGTSSEMQILPRKTDVFKEHQILRLDSSRAAQELGWTNKLTAEMGIEWAIDWERSPNKREATLRQVQDFLEIVSKSHSE